MAKIVYFSGEGAEFKRNIHSASTSAKKSLIYLQESGELTSTNRHSGKRANLESFLIFFVKSGKGELVYKGKKYLLNKNNFVFINCYLPYSHTSSIEEQWSLKWVHFYGEPAKEFYSVFAKNSASPVFTPQSIADMEEILDYFNSDYPVSESLQDIENAKYLTDLCISAVEAVIPKTYDSNIKDIIDYIDKNYSENLTLDLIASTFYISKFTLSHKFKTETGTTVLDYITKRRIKKAKELLRYSTKSIEQISEECGVCNGNYFTKIFKKYEGVNPRDYRKQW